MQYLFLKARLASQRISHADLWPGVPGAPPIEKPSGPWTMSHSSQFTLLGKRRFLPFFITQSLGAFNDNLFKQSLILAILFRLSLGDGDRRSGSTCAPCCSSCRFPVLGAGRAVR
jgi:hypothetical protein